MLEKNTKKKISKLKYSIRAKKYFKIKNNNKKYKIKLIIDNTIYNTKINS